MAKKLGIIGEPNTGKSYSRKFIKEGEKVFVIAPSSKAMHITTSIGEPLKRLQVSTEKSKSLEEMRDKNSLELLSDSIPMLLKKNPEELTITGNYILTKLKNLESCLLFVDKFMPNINTIIIPDTTHFVSSVIGDREFIKRKAGGEAFQRFWELAGDILNGVIESIDKLRDDLIVVTEYHSEYDENSDSWKIFMPGGKMVIDKFKLDSYYDFMLYTCISAKDDGLITPDSYKFVTRKHGKYNARMSELFKDTFIPNNLEIVLTKLREYNGI